MSPRTFRTIDARLLAAANVVFKQRTGAYAERADQLANIREMAHDTGISELQVCALLLGKGMRVLKKLARTGKLPAGESVEERFADAINYLRLMYAAYQERVQARKPRNRRKRKVPR